MYFLQTPKTTISQLILYQMVHGTFWLCIRHYNTVNREALMLQIIVNYPSGVLTTIGLWLVDSDFTCALVLWNLVVGKLLANYWIQIRETNWTIILSVEGILVNSCGVTNKRIERFCSLAKTIWTNTVDYLIIFTL